MQNTDLNLQEKLSQNGWEYTSHKKDLGSALGHGANARGLTLDEVKTRLKDGFPVIGAKCGVKLANGHYSIIIDADAPGLHEWLETKYPDSFGKTLTAFGSKAGHFYFEVDCPVESSSIDNSDKTRAIDILGIG